MLGLASNLWLCTHTLLAQEYLLHVALQQHFARNKNYNRPPAVAQWLTRENSRTSNNNNNQNHHDRCKGGRHECGSAAPRGRSIRSSSLLTIMEVAASCRGSHTIDKSRSFGNTQVTACIALANVVHDDFIAGRFEGGFYRLTSCQGTIGSVCSCVLKAVIESLQSSAIVPALTKNGDKIWCVFGFLKERKRCDGRHEWDLMRVKVNYQGQRIKNPATPT